MPYEHVDPYQILTGNLQGEASGWSISVCITGRIREVLFTASVISIFPFLYKLSLIDGIFPGVNTNFFFFFYHVSSLFYYSEEYLLPIILLNLILRLFRSSTELHEKAPGRDLYSCIDPRHHQGPPF